MPLHRASLESQMHWNKMDWCCRNMQDPYCVLSFIVTAEPPPIDKIPNDNEYEDRQDKTDEIEVISRELVIGIIAAATFVLCCLVFAFGYLCTKGMKRKYLPNKDYEKCEMVAVDGTIARMLKTDNVQTWQNTMNPTMIRNDHMPVVAQDRDFITVNTNNL
ncbi:hypothetical protein CAPTEDRAFT_212351 [Capitella teleta]|uniref:Uncharacterized protein n=2 Tax=Capitella teleta TaxID=283909 RepID=R7V0P7_CAPTE|nr:hypothetical protein CAPTEDRAFT_212351 [Capitella teleta]|eukprot:ELU12413.1 hypothetical protein CAPTEDRAFT_212351 [Capitella teleta]